MLGESVSGGKFPQASGAVYRGPTRAFDRRATVAAGAYWRISSLTVMPEGIIGSTCSW